MATSTAAAALFTGVLCLQRISESAYHGASALVAIMHTCRYSVANTCSPFLMFCVPLSARYKCTPRPVHDSLFSVRNVVYSGRQGSLHPCCSKFSASHRLCRAAHAIALQRLMRNRRLCMQLNFARQASFHSCPASRLSQQWLAFLGGLVWRLFC